MNPLNKRILWKRTRRNLVWILLLVLVWLMCSAQAVAQPLQQPTNQPTHQPTHQPLVERQQAFPNWHGKPPVQVAEGDLAYPQWMLGTWRMDATLVDMVAPLAPQVVTPGFEGNRQFLDKSVPAIIRFVSQSVPLGPQGRFLNQPLPNPKVDTSPENSQVVSDRAFNGLSLARAYLGDEGVKAVKVDPDNPNRQITFFKSNQQLISTVTGRKVESPNPVTFATTEVFQQFFRNPARSFSGAEDTSTIYLNEVENTTLYHKRSDPNVPIEADQMTAIYLSPQDPNYFKAKDQPVALYRYQLSFSPA